MHEELTKSMTTILKPSADFLTSNKLLKVCWESQCDSAIFKLIKKIHTPPLDQFTLLCGFRDNHQLLKSGNRVSSSIPILLLVLMPLLKLQIIIILKVFWRLAVNKSLYLNHWGTVS